MSCQFIIEHLNNEMSNGRSLSECRFSGGSLSSRDKNFQSRFSPPARETIVVRTQPGFAASSSAHSLRAGMRIVTRSFRAGWLAGLICILPSAAGPFAFPGRNACSASVFRRVATTCQRSRNDRNDGCGRGAVMSHVRRRPLGGR